MANAAYPTPQLLLEPGVLYSAPIGSALPTPVVTGSVFTDPWPVAWVPLGLTESGTSFQTTVTTSPVMAAEYYEAIRYPTTARDSQITFSLKSFTATNLQRALNGAVTTVTGSTTTTLTQIDPPAIGTEVRCMVGFESLDSTYRFVGFQCFNSGAMKRDFVKAPATTLLPFTLMLEKPASSQAFREWTAGANRA